MSITMRPAFKPLTVQFVNLDNLKIFPNAIDHLLKHWDKAQNKFHCIKDASEVWHKIPPEHLFVMTDGAVYANLPSGKGYRWGRVVVWNEQYQKTVKLWENKFNTRSKHYDEEVARDQYEFFNIPFDDDEDEILEDREEMLSALNEAE